MKEQSTFVFSRPEYTGEEGYVERKADIEKQIEESNNTPRDQYVSMDQAIEHFEKQCSEIDYTKLRPGVKVKLKINIDGFSKWFKSGGVYEILNCNGDSIKLHNNFAIHKYYIESIIEEPQEQKHPYAKPKRVKALWLEQTEGDIECYSVNELYMAYDWIGFIPSGYRYNRHILTANSTSDIFLATGTKSYPACVEDVGGLYFVFETARDLYLWMAEGEGE